MDQDHVKGVGGQWGQKLISHLCEEDGQEGILSRARPPSHCPVTAAHGGMATGDHTDLMGIPLLSGPWSLFPLL